MFVSGGLLFAGYYLCFFALDIYTVRSLATGAAMAAALIAAGLITPRLDDRGFGLVNVLVAVVLGVGATLSAAFSGGSHCIGFHTIWALPLIYSVFVRDSPAGSVAIGLLSFMGGLAVLIADESDASRVAQWMTLSGAAGAFAWMRQHLDRRNLELTVAENELAHTRLAEADRMASLGLLAAGVAHEVNNPMTYVATNIEFAAQQLAEARRTQGLAADQDIDDALADARAGCERVSTIVKTLSRMSHDRGGHWAPVDVNRVIADVVRLSRRELQAIVVVSVTAGEVPRVSGDEARLAQVFLNLIVNGAHAVEHQPLEQRSVEVRTYTSPSGQVVVEVRDGGCGIAPNVLPHIFEPFFTTKPAGKGTGLGLALCAETVQAHRGTIEVESTPGQGALFRVVLPALAQEALAGSAAMRPEGHVLEPATS